MAPTLVKRLANQALAQPTSLAPLVTANLRCISQCPPEYPNALQGLEESTSVLVDVNRNGKATCDDANGDNFQGTFRKG